MHTVECCQKVHVSPSTSVNILRSFVNARLAILKRKAHTKSYLTISMQEFINTQYWHITEKYVYCPAIMFFINITSMFHIFQMSCNAISEHKKASFTQTIKTDVVTMTLRLEQRNCMVQN
jgi:hypothetical protein